MKEKVTESNSHYNHLEKMNINDLLININKEDKKVANAVEKSIPHIELLINTIINKLQKKGRLFYIGSGTSGRLGIIDASECPPTFGVNHDLLIGLIAGGDGAIRKAVEFAEDDPNQGWTDLKKYNISSKDIVIGIAASGTTPYVVGAINHCNNNNICTGAITCNKESPLASLAKYPIEVIVGPEFITGSTRMKSGTAQKLVLNMISTTVMIKLGYVKDNKMVDMKLSNNKLVTRGTKMLMDKFFLNFDDAKKILLKYGSVRNAIKNHIK